MTEPTPTSPSTTGDLDWYLVHSRPRQEATAEVHLRRQGYEAYFPRLKLPRLRASRWVEAVDALFPRYLFVGIRAGEQCLSPVRSTRGVAKVVRFGERYTPISRALLNSLKARESACGVHVLNSVGMKPGDRVNIIAGPFAGLEAVFQEQQGTDRVRVLLELIGTVSRTTLPAGFVVPVFTPSPTQWERVGVRAS
jgi:transcriptional antiterminator RfaH